MRDVLLLIIHLVTLPVRLLRRGGIKAVAAENLVLKKQLLVIQRTRGRAPNLTTMDRFIFGWLAMMLTPRRMVRSAIIIKPSTLLSFHKTLVKRKYLQLFALYKYRSRSPIPISPLEIEEIKSIPFTPISHPYVEQIIGTIRRECLDQTLFWNVIDLQNKLDDFTDYYNHHRIHSSLNGSVPNEFGKKNASNSAGLTNFSWQSFCRGLVQLPIPA